MDIIDSWNKLDFDTTPFLRNAEVINKIIKPISDHFGLDCFNYHKTFADWSHIRLSNTVYWYKHYLSEELYLESIFELSADKYETSYFLWSTIASHQNIIKEAAKFDIYQGVTIVNKIGEDCEFYFLGMSSRNPILYRNLVLNINQLIKFIPYYSIEAKTLIQEISAFKAVSKDMARNSTNFDSLYDFNKIDFIMDINRIKLTAREKDVALLLINNQTSKQIALSLELSYRTVEQYINQLKVKIKAIDKKELEYKLRKLFI